MLLWPALFEETILRFGFRISGRAAELRRGVAARHAASASGSPGGTARSTSTCCRASTSRGPFFLSIYIYSVFWGAYWCGLIGVVGCCWCGLIGVGKHLWLAYGSKLVTTKNRTAGFSPCFHLPWQAILGTYLFLPPN